MRIESELERKQRELKENEEQKKEISEDISQLKTQSRYAFFQSRLSKLLEIIEGHGWVF